MKLRLLLMLGFVVCSSSISHAQPWRDNRAKICFDRGESNGSINTLQSWIRVGDYDIPLLGGQAACLFLNPGSVELLITSTVPYDLKSKNDEACKSKKLNLNLNAGENRSYFIEPATKGDTYACGWRINRTDHVSDRAKHR